MAIGPALAAVNGIIQWFGVPGKISSIVVGAIGLSIWWFVKQDHGAGVVIEVTWLKRVRFVPAYQG